MNGKKLLDLLKDIDAKLIEEKKTQAIPKPTVLQTILMTVEKCRILTKVYFSGKTRNSPPIKEGESQIV